MKWPYVSGVTATSAYSCFELDLMMGYGTWQNWLGQRVERGLRAIFVAPSNTCRAWTKSFDMKHKNMTKNSKKKNQSNSKKLHIKLWVNPTQSCDGSGTGQQFLTRNLNLTHWMIRSSCHVGLPSLQSAKQSLKMKLETWLCNLVILLRTCFLLKPCDVYISPFTYK